MIRFLCVALFVVLFLILSIPLLLFEWLLGKISPKAQDLSSLRIVQWAFRRVLAMTGAEVTVLGTENIPDEAVLFIGNHRSYFDILLSCVHFRRPTGFIAKDSMASIPLLSSWMRLIHCHFLNRSSTREGLKTILAAMEEIRQGVSVFIYPEGTRDKCGPDQVQHFREGSFKIATKTGCPIVPVTVANSDQIFERHIPFIRKARVVLEFGAPILPEALSPEEQKHIGPYFQSLIQRTLEKNTALYL